MPDIAKGYVQIIPTTKGIKNELTDALNNDASEAGEKAGEKAGNSLAGKLKNVLVAAGIGATITKGISAALNEGGALQQSFGGLETLYGDAADAAKAYAMEAAKAGISANDYAEQAVSFGASLKQAFEGDTAKAVEAANTAIMDMTDNAAKMGTPIENIQSAYQGFAKQNYTMLDNLKLGYGGTKTEMERLLKDATKLSGVEYNIDNLGDVYEAIHVIQEDLGLTGVAAQEASETFSGSFGAMKAAVTNVLATLSTGGDVQAAMTNLISSVGAFLFNNLIPMVGNVMAAIPPAMSAAMTALVPMIKEQGMNLLRNLVAGITGNMPAVGTSATELISTFLTSIISKLPTILKQGGDMILKLVNGIMSKAPDVLASINTILRNVFAAFIAALPQLLKYGVELILKLVSGIISKLPDVISGIAQIIKTIYDACINARNVMLQHGVELIAKLITGIGNKIKDVSDKIGEVISTITDALSNTMETMKAKGSELIGNVAEGIGNAVKTVTDKAGEIINAITGAFDVDFSGIGSNIIGGIAKGITNAVKDLTGAAIEACGQLTSRVKSFFGIASPSKLFAKEVGQWIPAGIAKGITSNMDLVQDALSDVQSYVDLNDPSLRLSGAIDGTGYGVGTGFTQNITINSPTELSPWEVARQTRNATQQMALRMSGV